MEIIFESTEEFEEDLKTYSEAEQTLILQQLHEYSSCLLQVKGYRERRLHQFYQFDLLGDYASSLYSFIVNYYLRVILTIDDDPLFNRTIITLFRVVDSQVVAKVYQQVGESIYQSFLQSTEFIEVQSNNGTVVAVTG
ncbi:hypothetical protein PCC9214_02480 [Planktothrix tepida]|uniref:Uncharacterized protein n=2 Tax=Planktothrix TaxID=54304 RepID=A0A1J1LKT1_9CYAN|nr:MULTISPECIES: hypothetical protein [Planktothrix]CAD5949822.1 hypothetical protein PCC9214_02480 [Planktothrix tepida]CAD5960912.1 hypothetical protein NO713_03191 [Planktothrix pseudagardhii]CUR32524.1 conserved hypothetical protein [Planktothrix tepida PCC 9214]